MEKEYRLSWIKITLGLVFVVIVVAMICLVFPDHSRLSEEVDTVYIANLNQMKEAGFNYFSDYNLPDDIGGSVKISLNDMVVNDLVPAFRDEVGNSCNMDNSYIEVTKELDVEYTMKVFLSCDNKTDYIVTNIVKDNYDVVANNILEDTASFSSNSDDYIESDEQLDVSVSNKQEYKPATPQNSIINNTTNIINNNTYNINYINTCGGCYGVICNNSCLNNKYYTVSFDANGGTPVASKTIKSGEYVPYVETTRVGYTFLGWYLDGALYNFGTPVTRTINLVAKWQKNADDVNIYRVSFITNGGSSVPSQNIYEGKNVVRPSDPTKSCNRFAGWYTNVGLTIPYNFNNGVYQDLILYAKWEDDYSCNNDLYYTVSFNANGGVPVASKTVKAGGYVSYVETTRVGYTFLGWYLGNSLYDFGMPVTKSINLVARWQKNEPSLNVYQVNFVTNGAGSIPTENVVEGQRVNRPSDPVRACYNFSGWYTDLALTNLYNFNNGVYQNLTLYAKWTMNDSCKNRYTVSFDANGGSYVASKTNILEGDYVTRPSNPVRTGYTFRGWYYNGSLFDFTTRIYQNYYLVAKWEKDTVKYNTYCKITSEVMYSTSTIGVNTIAGKTSYSYNYDIRYYNNHARNLRLKSYSNLKVSDDYYKAYNYWKNPNISWVGDTSIRYDALSGANLMKYSLKGNNLSSRVSYSYGYNSYYYFNVLNQLYNLNNITEPSYSIAGGYLYFVPLYFEIEYTDLNNCIDDLASRSSNYSNYEIINSYYK